jgi:hypothetical protein
MAHHGRGHRRPVRVRPRRQCALAACADVSTALSLAVIGSVLAITTIASLWRTRREASSTELP